LWIEPPLVVALFSEKLQLLMVGGDWSLKRPPPKYALFLEIVQFQMKGEQAVFSIPPPKLSGQPPLALPPVMTSPSMVASEVIEKQW